MTKVAYIVRDQPAGNPESGETVTVATAAGATLATPTTDGNGIAVYEQDGSPGPMVATATVGGRTVKRDGRSIDQLGTWFPPDAPVFWRTLGNGVIPGYSDPETAANDMAVSAGSGLAVNVATGATLIDGHLYRCTGTTEKTLSANASGSTRYDRIVVRFTREGQTTEGTCVLAVLEGTPGAGDAPALTRSAATYEVSLAKVRVVNGASSLTSGDLTDERYAPALYQSYVPTNPNAFSGSTSSYQAGDLLYVNSAGKLTRLAKGTDGQFVRLVSGLPAWQSATLTVTVQEGDVDVDAAVTTLDFDASDFTITSSPAGEANIALAYGTTAGTPAEGDHTHTIADGSITDAMLGTGISATHIGGGLVTSTEFNQLADISTASSIQTQLNAKSATTHTHEQVPSLMNNATKTYGFTSVSSTTGASVTSCDITLLSGVTYDIHATGFGVLNAPSGGSITLGVKIGAGGIDWGTEVQVVGGDKAAFASAVRTVTGPSTQTVALYCKVSGSSGSITTGHVTVMATPRNVPAS
jgi:hypothetical protein